MRAAIVAAGVEDDLERVRSAAADCQLVICADGGYRLARAAGLRVDLVVGDLDSLDPGELPPEQSVERHRCDKDESDLELAILAARARGASELVILGALGGRWDHSLFNLVACLEFAQEQGCLARLIGPGLEARLVGRECELQGVRGSTCSLLALDSEVRGIYLEGFRYPLAGESLLRARSRGLSNVVEAELARIRVGEGQLLLLLLH